jgi:dipeptidyl aminopeptidase/acylaminoacyl peptidase
VGIARLVRGRPAFSTRAARLRRALPACACALFAFVVSSSVALHAAAGDPALRWWTLESPHFRLHYHDGLAPLAQRIAGLSERAHETLAPLLGARAGEITQIVLSDESDEANGVASARPYNSIRLLVSAPDDMSPLADYDDWYDELVTHEYTHVLHLDNTAGLPAILNAIFGKLYTPNDWQPRFLIEGLGVLMESEHTTGGRLQSSQFEMFLRADVLDRRFVPLDQLSHLPRRWPSSHLAYVYGSRFLAWIAETYGQGIFAAVADDYGRDLIPFGINRAIRRATGRTYPELYAAFRSDVEREVGRFAAAIRARGLREGVRLTRAGRIAATARFLPRHCSELVNGAGPANGDSRAPNWLLYHLNDGHEPGGVHALPLTANADGERRLITRASGQSLTIAPDCALVFDSVAPSRRRHQLSDLFQLDPKTRAESGLERARRRLTVGRRARSPELSPDGRRIAYVTNRAGTTTLRIAERGAGGMLERERVLVPSARYEQAFTPRFSPDGKQLVYGAWTRGGYRDLRLVDLERGSFRELWHDRAIDQQPSWSPDGKTLYFSSDRSGVSNIYAYELSTGALRQVTNVLTGAYYPEVSPDGRTLVYVGYDSFGYDLYALPLEPARFLAPPPPTERAAASPAIAPAGYPVKPYSALPTLRPYAYGLSYGTGTFGNALTLRTVGADAIRRHAFTASLTLESEGSEWQGSIDYAYNRLPFALHATLFRSVAPRADYRVGVDSEVVSERLVGLSTAVQYPLPGEFEQSSVGLSYLVADFSHDAPFGTRADPWASVPYEPSSGTIASVHAGYTYSSAWGSDYGVSAERGSSLSLGVDFADPAIGSETTLRAVQGSFATYLEAPWLDHHVFALALSGGSSAGTYPRRGLYATGGFADRPLLEAYTSGLLQSGFVLRGYEPGQFTGSEYTLLNAEYRFPLLELDRGISTLPLFVQRLSGTLFADYGGAYDTVDPDAPLDVMHLGLGGELWFSLTLGYRLAATLRLGLARGMDDEAPDGSRLYFVAASGF